MNSETNIFGTDPNDIVRNQFTDGETNVNRLNSNVTYRLPLVGKTWFIDFRYRLETEKRRNVKSTFDFDEQSQLYSDFNALLSSNFTNKNRSHRPSARLMYRTEKMTFRLGSGYTNRTIENSDQLRY